MAVQQRRSPTDHTILAFSPSRPHRRFLHQRPRHSRRKYGSSDQRKGNDFGVSD
ncbi:hypothetical protein BJ165DRAFT_1514147 [Panaeolus papilionaceus]|nr:hypothetical protein BJ165DRAFT_1514147 [Panaeolus papilionaceus]